MKRLLLIFAAGVILTSACKSGDKKEASALVENKTQEKTLSSAEKGKAIHLTKADFLLKVANFETNPQEWKYLGDKPCIIDFYADWCGPCKIAAPILEELAAEYADEIYIYKINTEEERELAALFGIQSIPAFLFCPMDKQPQMSAGIAKTPEDTKAMFKNVIDSYLLQ